MFRFLSTLLSIRQSPSAAPQAEFGQFRLLKGHIVVVALAVTSFLFVAMWMSTPARATSFTSTQSGSWGNASTWGGAGIPSTNDDVTISGGTAVTLDTTRAVTNLTIQNSATLDLAGHVLQITNGGGSLFNAGSISNSGAATSFVFTGNGASGAVVQTWGGGWQFCCECSAGTGQWSKGRHDSYDLSQRCCHSSGWSHFDTAVN
jgi:hypothetical protein